MGPILTIFSGATTVQAAAGGWATTTLLPWITGMGPVIIGFAVAYIAWQQHRTSKDKLRYDLYDRRFAAYEAVVKAIGDVAVSGAPSDTTMKALHEAVNKSDFIFGSEVRPFVSDILTQAELLRGCHDDVKSFRCMGGSMHTDALKTRYKLIQWFLEQREPAVQTFRPYLEFASLVARGRSERTRRSPCRVRQTALIVHRIGAYLVERAACLFRLQR